MPVKMYSGATHFSWLMNVQEVPDNNKDWKAGSSMALFKSNMLISYPESEEPHNLRISVVDNKPSLQLASMTSFELDKNEVGYFGLHHRNNGQQDENENENVDVVLTMDDGSKVNHKIKSVKQNVANFSGFIAEDGSTIKRIDINVPEGSELSIDRLQWGNLQESELENEQPVVEVSEEKPTEEKLVEQKVMVDEAMEIAAKPVAIACHLTPKVVQYQCDNNQWLFDVKVSNDNSRSAWWCSNDDDEQCASYEKIVSYGYYSKSEKTEMQLVFTDQDQQSCSQAITINLPENCEDACSYSYEDGKEIKSCDKNGSLEITMRKMY